MTEKEMAARYQWLREHIGAIVFLNDTQVMIRIDREAIVSIDDLDSLFPLNLTSDRPSEFDDDALTVAYMKGAADAKQDALNAPWLTLAHTICTDAGVEQGHIADRLKKLRDALDRSSHAGWISVKERLPEEYDEILITGKAVQGGPLGVHMGEFIDGDFWFYNARFSGGCNPCLTEQVTHWMPKPPWPATLDHPSDAKDK